MLVFHRRRPEPPPDLVGRRRLPRHQRGHRPGDGNGGRSAGSPGRLRVGAGTGRQARTGRGVDGSRRTARREAP